MTNSQSYTIQLDSGVTNVQLIAINGDTPFVMNGQPPASSITISATSGSGQPTTQAITVQSSSTSYIQANIICTYPLGASKNNPTATTSDCTMCFNLGDPGGDYWTIMGTSEQGDNTSIFAAANSGSTPIVEIQIPTAVNPSVPPSNAPVLDPNMVFLLDMVTYSGATNMIFRGNSPLAANTPSNPEQLINFPNFIQTLLTTYNKQVSDPKPVVEYFELDVIALLGPGEKFILNPEFQSFGIKYDPITSQQWYPPLNNPGVKINNEVTGRICRWDIEPATIPQIPNDPNTALAVKLAQTIYSLINTPTDSGVPRLIYIHCDSGHDRTGLMSTLYLVEKLIKSNSLSQPFSNADLEAAFINGTTLNYLPDGYSGGDYVQKCYNVGTTTFNPKKSRCFLISDSYNYSVIWGAEVLAFGNTPSKPPLTLTTTALTGDPQATEIIKPVPPPPAFVEPAYPYTSVRFRIQTNESAGWCRVDCVLGSPLYDSSPFNTQIILPGRVGFTWGLNIDPKEENAIARITFFGDNGSQSEPMQISVKEGIKPQEISWVYNGEQMTAEYNLVPDYPDGDPIYDVKTKP